MSRRGKKTEDAAVETAPEPSAEGEQSGSSARDDYVNALIAEADLTELETGRVLVAVSDGFPVEDAIAATLAARDAAAALEFEIEEVDDNPAFVNLYGGAFKAVCSDGWESEVRTTVERAESSAEEHRDEVRAQAFAEQAK